MKLARASLHWQICIGALHGHPARGRSYTGLSNTGLLEYWVAPILGKVGREGVSIREK